MTVRPGLKGQALVYPVDFDTDTVVADTALAVANTDIVVANTEGDQLAELLQ
jgi:SOS-response transcriptional repressor LexA